jgi:hypothetical protein
MGKTIHIAQAFGWFTVVDEIEVTQQNLTFSIRINVSGDRHQMEIYQKEIHNE